MRNASVEFDVESLKPTYRLMIGIPGSSNAFAIAERLGLDSDLIYKARSLVGSGDRKVEDMINSLRTEYESASSARRDAEILKRRAEESSRKLAEELAKFKSDRADALIKAKSEARDLVSFVRKEVEKTIVDLRQNGLTAASDSAREARKAVEALRAIVDEADGSEPEQEETVKDEFATPLSPGDDIEVLPSGLAGTLLEIVGNRAKVAVGSIRTELPVSKIRRARAKKKELRAMPVASRQSEIGRQMAQTISVELDLRGMKVDEAFEALDKRMDDAILAGIPMLRIIHGKGTGALRAAVRDRLTGNGNIESFRLGAEGEGGDGVTIVKFKQ
jgi:DNA mismatch repair protein MutS2